MIQIDGSRGEGGGQMVRSSLTMSCVTGRPVRIVNVRAGRKKPGLSHQHVECVRAAARICSATVTGDAVGSAAVVFEPQAVAAGDYRFSIGTAGSTALLLHTLYLPLALQDRPSTLRLDGGTHGAFAPTADYLQHAWAPAMAGLGLDVDVTVERLGLYPKGGGRLLVEIAPWTDRRPFRPAERGKLQRIDATAFVCDLADKVGQRLVETCQDRLRRIKGRHKLVTRVEMKSRSPAGDQGCWLNLLAQYAHGRFFSSRTGERGLKSEKLAAEQCKELLAFHDAEQAHVDGHLADQLLLPLLFAGGASAYATAHVTQHLLTNCDVLQRFTTRPLTVDGALGQPGRVSVGDAAEGKPS